MNCNRRHLMGLSVAAAGAAIFHSTDSSARDRMEPGTLDFSRSVPVTDGYDVAVCGGGPSGIAAAVSASCMGLKVLLMDSNAQLGGTCTSGLVSHWLGGRDMSCTTWVVGGLFKAFSDEAARRGCALIPGPVTDKKYQPHGWIKSLLHGIPIEPYGMARFLDEKVCQAGVDLLLNTQFVDVLLDRNHITHSIIFNKSGLSAVPVRAVVDATGDGDVAARSGCDCITGREEDGVQASVTLEFHVDQVAQDALAGYIEDNNCPRFKEQIARWSQQGTWKAASTFLITVQLTEKGVMMVNTPRIDGVDATDGRSITRGLLQCRKEIQDLFESLRKNVPGFEQARIKAVAPMLGVRESRRIRGNYQFTVAELESGRECQDVVGFSSYGWDLPHSINPSRRPTYGKSKKKLTPIPYRIMLPRPVRNLICPGRMVSVERVLLGPLRVMASCFAMGQAAGTAAAQVVADKTSFDRIDIQQLRQDLRGQGAIVDSDAI